ncbi:unnamed protein product [Echinostoma caproni]|uniref:alanine transaminase n=1 Tax=Echinostoma caproni TaxID=27848 RepID=A0A183AXN5_9TREM|nr:unnamed protein product [Echinostoma caproni]
MPTRIILMSGFKKVLNFNGLVLIPKTPYTKLSVNSINPNVVRLEYAVRGPIVQRAQEIEDSLKKGEKKGFDQIIKCNIGDCQAAGQKPITFIRNVLSVATSPDLFKSSSIPDDAKMRAKRFLDSCGGSVGVYSQSTGVQIVREDVARYIQNRDGLPANPNNIFLSSGASESILQLLATGGDESKRAGIMVPIPQYPLYSATNAEYNAYQVCTFLVGVRQTNSWGTNLFTFYTDMEFRTFFTMYSFIYILLKNP